MLIGIVSTPKDLAENTQLRARDWFVDSSSRAPRRHASNFPGPPYRLSETPAADRPPAAARRAHRSRPRGALVARGGDSRWPNVHSKASASPTSPGSGPARSPANTLATFGAEVVRVESEAKIDSLRVVHPFAMNPDGTFKSGYNVSGYFNNFNAGKLSIQLNLNTEKGQEIGYRTHREVRHLPHELHAPRRSTSGTCATSRSRREPAHHRRLRADAGPAKARTATSSASARC